MAVVAATLIIVGHPDLLLLVPALHPRPAPSLRVRVASCWAARWLSSRCWRWRCRAPLRAARAGTTPTPRSSPRGAGRRQLCQPAPLLPADAARVQLLRGHLRAAGASLDCQLHQGGRGVARRGLPRGRGPGGHRLIIPLHRLAPGSGHKLLPARRRQPPVALGGEGGPASAPPPRSSRAARREGE